MILIVEDNPTVRQALCIILQSAGHQVEEAGTVEEALSFLARGWAPKVILLDWCLPESNQGEQVLAAIMASPAREAAVVVVTGFVGELREQLKHASIKNVLAKPVQRDELLALVGQWDMPITKENNKESVS